MPARVALRFAVAALLLSVGCTRAGPAPLSEADKVALRAIDQRFADAVLAKNWAGAGAEVGRCPTTSSLRLFRRRRTVSHLAS
jgi:hypothetical protein